MTPTAHAAQPECRFCLGNGLLHDAPLFANDSCYFLASKDPILPHAGMIIPFRHSVAPMELTPTEWADTFDLLKKATEHLSPHGPKGFNVGWNVGAVGGQTVFHTHLHVIGRFADEPLAGQGIRHHLKRPENRRPGS